MPTDVVSIAVDVQASRLQYDRLAQLCDGLHWDIANSTGNAFVDMVTRTAMLMPLPFSPAWNTTATGNYARLRKSQLSIASSANYLEFSRPPINGNYYLHALGVNEKVYTLQSWQKNRPMWLSWYAYNSGSEAFEQMRCGWGEGTSAAVECRVWSDGNVDVYKNGSPVGNGSIKEIEYYNNELSAHKGQTGKPTEIMANEVIGIALIPCRHAELLILSNQGGGFNHKFEDIDPDDPNPTITGAGQFWYWVPAGQATVQVAPLKFATDCSLLSPKFRWRAAPGTGEVADLQAYYSLPGYGSATVQPFLKETDGITDFVPNGTRRNARLRVDLVSDGDSTPFVYGVAGSYPALTAETDNAPTSLDPYWMRAQWDVPDDPTGVKLKIELRNPAAIETAGATNLRKIGNRPIAATLGSYPIFRGRTMEPDADVQSLAEAEVLTLDCRDGWARLEKSLISDPEPLDGMNFSAALKFILGYAGYTSADWDIDDVDFPIPAVDTPSKGEWAYLPEVGDTVAMWVQKLWEEFARKYIYGFVPTPTGVIFQFLAPESLATTEQATVYLKDSDRPDAATPTEALKQNRFRVWATSFREKVAPPEANDIHVIGRNPRTNLPIVAHFRDDTSADPTVAVADRPLNWLGELRQYAWVNPYLTRAADVSFVLGTLSSDLPRAVRLAEWECQMLVKAEGTPIWRGNLVRVYGKGLYRIKAFSGTLDMEYADAGGDILKDRIDRRFKYTGEWIGE